MPCALVLAPPAIADTLSSTLQSERSSITAPPVVAARSAAPWDRLIGRVSQVLTVRALLTALLAALLSVCNPSPALAQTTAGGVRMGASIGAPEPMRPRVSVPYDGAIAAYRAGRTDEAFELTEAALKADPRNAELRFLRGVLLTERGRSDEALDVFQTMADDFPELPEPYNNIAFIQASRGQWEQARRALEQSINVVPSYALAHENLGDIHLQLAAQAYARAGRLNPQSTSARRKLATSLDLIGRTQAVPADPPTPPNPRPGAPSQVKTQ